MTENKRYKLNGDTFIDTVKGEVLIGYQGILDELNNLNDENTHIHHTIQAMIESERTELGKSVLKQLQEIL